MLYWLSDFSTEIAILNIFRYLTFRAGGAVLTAMLIAFICAPPLIKWLKSYQNGGQPIRTDGPQSHIITKKGTPTMGGVVMLLAIGISTILWADLTNPYIWIVLFVIFGFGFVGFIDDYIKPRFDQSKSMDEFISYLDTLDEDEQNVFQTQDAMQALKNVASAHAAAKLNQIQATPDQYFDASFYFDPTVAIDEREGYEGPRDEDYRKQAERVLADYEAANENPNSIIEGTESAAYPNGITWNQYAYYYGVDLSNQDQFARLHYDAIGSVNGYDPAKDVTSVADAGGEREAFAQ